MFFFYLQSRHPIQETDQPGHVSIDTAILTAQRLVQLRFEDAQATKPADKASGTAAGAELIPQCGFQGLHGIYDGLMGSFNGILWDLPSGKLIQLIMENHHMENPVFL